MKFKRILFLSILASSSLMASEKPNILFLFADDMSVNTIHGLGNEEIRTPHLDALAQSGTVFTHAYNSGAWGGAVCVASRTMLQTGVQVWNARRDASKLEKKYLDRKLFWPQLMEQAGYETWFSGKWHVKSNAFAEKAFNHTVHIRPGMPNQVPVGYDRPKSKQDKAWLPWDKKHGGYWKGGKHWSEVLADDGVAFLKQAAQKEKPFFMMLAFNAPHDPRQAPKKFCEMYPPEKISLPKSFLPEYPHEIGSNRIRDEKLAPFPRTPYAVQVNLAEYYALITHMDAQIGRILKALEETGQADNTVVIFTADHGLAVGHHGLIGKQNMYDHSVRVPWIISGPGVPKAKQVSAPIYLQDVMATALELGQAPQPKHVEFQSVLPHLKGEGTPRKSIYGAYMDYQRMVCDSKYKLIWYPKIKTELLFDLEKDPEEMQNLAKNPEYTKVLKQMGVRLQQQMKEMNDPLVTN